MHRVQKLLSNYGYCSRRKAEDLIKAGRVKVNSRLISIGDQAEEDDRIYVDNKLVKKQNKIYLMFNKPVGCVTALEDKHCRTIMEYIKVKERVFPIGRLDMDTSGLLLLTNDGDFSNRIMHPRYETRKTYRVRLDKPVSSGSIKEIESGIELEDGKTSPAKVRKIENNLIEITVHEGKNRIIRRMMEHLGYKVISLSRIRIGELELGSLKSGACRELTGPEHKKIFG